MAVLLATLGGAWQVVPELYGFTNPEKLPLYRESPEAASIDALRERHAIVPVDEIWLVSTERGAEQKETLEAWARAAGGVPVRMWWPKGMDDMRDAEDARAMAELILRLLWHAHERHDAVHLGLAGGRKTMSADLQRAGELLGWASLLHVIDRFTDSDQASRFAGLPPDLLAAPLEGEWASVVLPVVVAGPRPPSDLVAAGHDALAEAAGALPEEGAVTVGATSLLDRIEELQARAAGLVANHVAEISGTAEGGVFRALYALPLRVVERLRSARIGTDPRFVAEELAWLRILPKAELHCHLGGVLDAAGMIEVAASEAARVHEARRAVPGFDRDLGRVEAMVRHADLDGLRSFLGDGEHGGPDFKGLRGRWKGVPEPLGVCGFLLAFSGQDALLDALVFGEFLDAHRFRGVGIRRYEALGDLQGSGLLQSEATLRETLRIAARRAREDGVRYLELRCSPANYTRGGLDARRVVQVLLDAIDEVGGDDLDIRLIFIASRHGRPDRAEEHVRLATTLRESDARFGRRFVGFDLAGAEHVAEPARFRGLFRPLHEQVVRITIHAGEGEDVGNVWQAVYELSADRIGHGLTLTDNRQLLHRFRDREIAVEMCPSSNFQIVGQDKGGPFADNLLGVQGRRYPLAEYLRSGLRVAVCTDDPGVSRTTLSREYHKAAAMTEGGFSRWDVLRLVRNGFRAAFCGHDERQRHMRAAEEEILRRCVEETS